MSTARKRPGRVTAPRPRQRLRLVKVLLQPVFVLDDGKTLTEVTAQVTTVIAADWDEWSRKAFTPEALGQLALELRAGQNGAAPAAEAPPQ